MSNEKTPEMLGNNAVSRDNAETEAPPLTNTAHLEATQSNVSNTLEKPEHIPNLNHVEALNLPDAAALEKKIVRRLDMTMLPQLWILYMFNYLNRVNIAQARLNTFNEDLNLRDGDYQVRPHERRVKRDLC